MGTVRCARASDRNMMLIAISLSAILFHHDRTPVPAPSLQQDVCTAVTIVIDDLSTIPEPLASAMLQETAMIWKPFGIDVRGKRGDVSPRTTIVHLIVTDDVGGASSSDDRLGWIRFVAPNRPEPVMYVSRLAARQLLDGVPTLRTRPSTYRDVLLSRIMGRALAHELGHYLFASTAHSSRGLMRGSWPLDLLIANDRGAFRLAASS